MSKSTDVHSEMLAPIPIRMAHRVEIGFRYGVRRSNTSSGSEYCVGHALTNRRIFAGVSPSIRHPHLCFALIQRFACRAPSTRFLIRHHPLACNSLARSISGIPARRIWRHCAHRSLGNGRPVWARPCAYGQDHWHGSWNWWLSRSREQFGLVHS